MVEMRSDITYIGYISILKMEIMMMMTMLISWYVLVPSYALLGAWTSPSFIARASSVNVSAANLGLVCSDPEDPDETRRDCILRRLNRCIKLAEDLGLAIGCLVAAAMLRATADQNWTSTSSTSDFSEIEIEQWCGAEYMAPDQLYLLTGLELPFSTNDSNSPPIQSTANLESPVPLPLPTTTSTATDEGSSSESELNQGAARLMLSAWLGLATLAFGLSCALLDGRVRDGGGQTAHERAALQPGALLAQVRSAFRDPRMQLTAPLTLFIGLEQGFIFADFTEAYVVCALGGADKVALSFLSLGLLQALAGVTLSMLMRHIRRYLVVVVGFAFHACLILVLVTWRPAGDDPALFHVISAAWGVCNAIWETLIYSESSFLYS
ncbi:hypothetical protein QAD02_018714 [Eretmocerus hayati]|uniref:Uncharacterized protein n=1 Tax=Eretmocerus hayati TaxID=131215 RepID=A0ACC2PHI7_9HYME|nr:hypothetical protein QAD02_018714 [Eretmocerus hayati]